MIEVREKTPTKDNLYMFKKRANHNLATYDGTHKPKAFEDLIQGMKILFNAL